MSRRSHLNLRREIPRVQVHGGVSPEFLISRVQVHRGVSPEFLIPRVQVPEGVSPEFPISTSPVFRVGGESPVPRNV